MTASGSKLIMNLKKNIFVRLLEANTIVTSALLNNQEAYPVKK